jgi:DNA-binding response OmpR family regulator
MKGKILVVDDEETMRRSVADILSLEGYQVQSVDRGKAALAALQAESYDLMLLDLKMPGMDGVEVMRNAARIAPDTKIILLTAHGSLQSAIEALRHEAHDYLLKPVTPQELLASVASGIARHSEMRQRHRLLNQMESSLQQLKDAEKVESTKTYGPKLVDIGENIKIDLDRREIWKGSERINLTPTEGKLMKVLLENRGQVLSHRELVLLVQGYEVTDWEAPEVLRPLISRLRRKLKAIGEEERIVNVRGTGYVFEENVPDGSNGQS